MQGVAAPTDSGFNEDLEPNLESEDDEAYVGNEFAEDEFEDDEFEDDEEEYTIDDEQAFANLLQKVDVSEATWRVGSEAVDTVDETSEYIDPKPKKKKKSKPAGDDSIEGFAKRWKLPMSVPSSMLERLRDAGFWKPMMIQERAMPLIVEGESVVLHAATGCGKTLAFLVPLLTRMEYESNFRAIIAVPSQELAVQIAAEAEQLVPSQSTNRILLAISSSKEIELEQQDKIFGSKQMPQLLIGTPQRLASLCRHPRARPMVRQVAAMVLDEVDLMLPPVQRKVEEDVPGLKVDLHTGGRWGAKNWKSRSLEEDAFVRRKMSKKPAGILLEDVIRYRPRSATPLQLISCSATVTSDVRRQIAGMLGMPEKGKKAAGRVVTADPLHKPPKSYKALGLAAVSMPSTIKHTAYRGTGAGLNTMLQTAFLEYMPTAALLVIPNGKSVPAQVEELHRLGYTQAEALQDALDIAAADSSEDEERKRPGKGNLLQSQMTNKRKELSAAFASRSGDVPLLVTNEHSARGIDLKFIDFVFLMGLPKNVDSYIHVVGRTGREGRKGRAVTMLTTEEEYERLAEFRRDLGCIIEEVDLRFINY